MNEFTEKQLTDKIRGLLALAANAGTEAEAATAAAAAARICAKHNIDKMRLESELHGVQGSAFTQNVNIVQVKLCPFLAVIPKHYFYLFDGVKTMLDVFIYFYREPAPFGGSKITQYYVMGQKENCDAAVQVMAYFIAIVESMLKDRKISGEISGSKQSDSYRKGAACGISDNCKLEKTKLIESFKESTALICLHNQLVKQKVDEFYRNSNMTTKKSTIVTADALAFQKGRVDGRTVKADGQKVMG